MRANKAGRGGLSAKGLAELKRLRKAAESAAPVPAAPGGAAPRRAASGGTAPGGTAPGGTAPGKLAGSAALFGVDPPRGPASAPRVGDARRASGPLDDDAGLSREDRILFRLAVKSVAPIKDTRRAILAPVLREPADVLRQRRERAMGKEAVPLATVSDAYTPASEGSQGTDYLRPGYGPDLLKGLRRGKWPVGASLDLHGDTLDVARERLERFLQSCLEHQIKCVRVVHGKGYGSKDGEAVLKQAARSWLAQMDAVLAYVECAEQDGGAGAVQVLLRLGPADAKKACA